MRKLPGNRFVRLFGGQFARSVITLGSGTAAGQLVTVVASPVLTRIYAPEQIGVLATFVSLISVLGAVAALRLEVAIPLPHDSKAAANVLFAAVTVVIAFGAAGTLTVLLVDESIFVSLGLPGIDHYLWLLPVGLVTIGLHHAFTQWAIRSRSYRVIAKSRLLQTSSSALFQIGAGVAVASTLGLLVGHIIGSAAAATVLARETVAGMRRQKDWRAPCSLVSTLVRYRRFPLISAPASLLNSFALAAPVLILAFRYGPEAAAMYAIAHRAVGTPLGLVSQSVGQVFYAEGARLAERNPRALVTLFLRVTKALLAFGVLPVALIAIAGPTIFRIVFGPEWEQAGVLARILCALFLGQIIASPVSGTLHILERQGAAAALDVIRALAIIAALIVPSHLGMPLETAVTSYSIVMAVTYAAWWWTSFAAVSAFQKSRAIST